MELRDVVVHRRSIRHFLPKPVPDEILKELLADAFWAPSWGNTQPWVILVVTGPPLESFERENREAFLSGRPSNPDIPMPQARPEALRVRYKDLGKSILSSLSIDRQDQEGRTQHYARMYYLFDAPVLLLITIDKELSLEYAMLDVGLFLQTFSLLAHNKGLSSCPLAVSVRYLEMLRSHFSIPDTRLIVIGVAVGWPDPDAPVNRFGRKRAASEELVRWIR